ncbi:MAG TPA: N-acetylglucosamine-6-phosphate deacetylase [Candidatus Sulfotelmatobacter sp.]|nr:N-acetylglucosamine-6-phosphate deacetylase [Candidatus Sulfotelmatobacter sp.]
MLARGRLVLEEAIVPGRLHVEDGRIAALEPDEAERDGPFIAPGFADLHVHGWGGHDAMGSSRDLDGMARALLRHGVTAFLPTAVTADLDVLAGFAERVRAWLPVATADGALPLGFNLEGPFISPHRKGAQDPAHIVAPASVPRERLAPLLDGMRVMTVAPEGDGAVELIRWLAGQGVVVSLGHSAATLDEARAGYAAGARSTTHLFNAMSGVDHRAPGLAVAALVDDAVAVELIADGQHVHPALWPIVARTKAPGRLLLVSDALPAAGTGDGPTAIGGLAVEIAGRRATLAGSDTLAGSVIALDSAVRNLVAAGLGLPTAVAAAGRDPLALLGVTDRGRLAVGQVADLVELDDALEVRRVARAGEWLSPR